MLPVAVECIEPIELDYIISIASEFLIDYISEISDGREQVREKNLDEQGDHEVKQHWSIIPDHDASSPHFELEREVLS